MICRYCHKDAPDGLYCIFCGKRQDVPRSVHKRGNGQGTAFKRGNSWTAMRAGYSYIDDTGLHRVRPKKGGFATKKEALEWASSSSPQETYSPKLIELWALYEKNDLPKLSANRQTAYKIAFKRLSPLMGTQIHLLTLEAIQGTINAACNSFYPARDCKTVMKALYNKALASNNGLVTKNLADFIVLPKLEETEITPFTADEVKAFWNLYDKNDYFVGYILLMIYSGMMPAELLACKKAMIDLEKCEIFGCGVKTKSRKKSAIVFPDLLRPVVQTLLSYQTKNVRFLTVGREGFYTEYYACLDRANVPHKPPYSCRHTYGTEAVKLGVHPAVVQKMLRHSNTKMQERYTHLTSEEAHTAANLFSRGSQVATNEPASG